MPSGKTDPVGYEQITVTVPSIVSVALASYRTTAPDEFWASTVTSAGSVSTGGSVSGLNAIGAEPSLSVAVRPNTVTVTTP